MKVSYAFYRIQISSAVSKLFKFSQDLFFLNTLIKLFIVELQRLYGFLKEEEIEFIEEREFLSVIKRNYKPNKTILGIFQSNFSQNQRVR